MDSWLIKQLHNPLDNQAMVIAHRDEGRNALENSLYADKLAIAIGEMGSNFISTEPKMV